MLNLKKMLSGFLATAMVTAAIPVIVSHAEETFDVSDESYILNSWTMYTAPDEYYNYFNYVDNFVQPTAKYARTGNYALYIDYNDKEKAETYIRLTNQNSISLSAGTYTIEFWGKGSYDYYNAIHTGLYWKSYFNVSDFEVSEPDGEGWVKYSKEFEITEDYTNIPFCIYAHATANMVIDDMTLYSNSDAGKTNLIHDGGFEDATKLDVAENKYTVNGWQVQMNNIPENLANRTTFAEVSDKDSYNEGGKSLHVVYPTKRDYTETFIRYYQVGTFTAGTMYHLSFKAKGNFYFSGGLDWEEASFNTSSGTKTELEDGWVQYDYDLTPVANRTMFRLDFDRKIYDLYLDDITLTAQGSTENLLKNGNFEDAVISNFNVKDEKGLLKINSWEVLYNNISDKEKNYAQPTKKYARSGNYAMYMNYEDGYVGETYVLIQNANKPALPAGDYQMEFYTLGKCTDWAVYCGVYWTSYASREDINLWKKEVCSDGWTKHTYEFTVTEEDKSRNFGFHIQKNGRIVVDDVKLVNKNAPDVNLIHDGGFEDVTETVIPTEIINPVAYPVRAGEAVSLSWKNPDTTYISDIKVLVNGVKYSGLAIDKTANAINECVVEGLTNGKEYEISVVPVIRGAEYPVVMKAVPNVWYDVNFGDWTAQFGDNLSDSGNYYANSVVEIAEEDGNKVMSIKSNTNANVYKGNVYARVAQRLVLEKNKKYRLVGKVKTEGKIYHISLVQEGSGIWHSPDILPWGHSAANGEWIEFSADLSNNLYDQYSTETYEAFLSISTDRANGEFLLDDIGVYEIDKYDETQVVGSNLIANGGFDYDDYKVENTAFRLVEGENRTAIDKIQVGTIEVSATIRNYLLGNDFNAFVAVALYNGGKLEEVTVMEKNIPQLSLAVPAGRFVTTVNVPSATGYEIKVMYWDGSGTMKTLDGADILK